MKMRSVTCILTPARASHHALLGKLSNAAKASTSKDGDREQGVCIAAPITSSFYVRKRKSLFPTLDRCRILPQPILINAATPTNVTSGSVHGRFFSASAAQRGLPSKLPRDYDIPYHWVRVVDDDGQLGPPLRKSNTIFQLPKGYSLVMLAPPPLKGDGDEDVEPAAICRIVNEAAQRAAQKSADKEAEEADKEAKRLSRQTKTIELNWAIAPHDLGHRLKNFVNFLTKGLRVEVMLARKRGSRKATQEEINGLYERIREIASEHGASEYRSQDGKLGGTLRLFFQGTKKKADKSTPAVEEEVTGKDEL